MEKITLSTEPYKGTRDFYPADMAVQQYMFDCMRRVAQRFGYEEYTASLLEETALYKAKSGEEIVNEQTYSFTDRGGRDVTIRPEMTPTVARMVARKRMELPFPLRWFSIPNLFRYEKPQRGRLREHWQLNVDIFGVENMYADAEVVTVAATILQEFGIQQNQFEIRLNNRKLVNFVLHDFCALSDENAYALSKLIDRRAKMPKEEFEQKVRELVGEKTSELIAFLNTTSLDDVPEAFRGNAGYEELTQVVAALRENGVTNARYDASIIRGFDYYTGTIFEVYDLHPENNRALFGGGRYDDLVGIFGVEPVGGVGFGMGDVTMRDVLETYNLLPEYAASADIQICLVDTAQTPFANELAQYLRSHNINAAIDYTGRKIGKQIQTADKQHVPYVICIGEGEAESKQFTVKQLSSGEEKKCGWDELPAAINNFK